MEEEKKEIKEEEKSGSKTGAIKWKSFVLGVGSLVVLAGVFGVAYTVYAVKNASTSPTVLKVAAVLNLPVAKVNGESIPYVLYVDDVQTLNAFYKKAPEGSFPPATDDEISDQVLSRLIVNSLLKDIARKNKLVVSDEDVQKSKDTIFAGYGTEEEVEAELKTQYGWDIPTYIEKIVKPMLLEQKVSEAFGASEIEADAEGYEGGDELRASHILFRIEDEEGNELDKDVVIKSAQEILARALSGEDFAALASEFGSDATKDLGGDLNWFSKGMMVPEFETAAYSTKVGEVRPELVETQFGYHVLKVTDKRTVRNFGAYINDKISNAKIEILVKSVHDPLEEFKKQLEEFNNPQEAVEEVAE
ncbi:MAG: peptidylprolyl isomerase [bacterium]|nr:peptidylprolyl isomerase [bacterium]